MKKIILLLSAAVVLISCSKVGKGEFLISGTAKGIENGKTIILQTQNESGTALLSVDTVKVQDGKFEIKGKITEPSFHMLQLESSQEKIPFILENGEIVIAIDKDSINKSKISGTYNNDEFVKFNADLVKLQKGLVDFQKNNTEIMNKAQQTNDTAAINKLMKEFSKIQQTVGEETKGKYLSYSDSHPKSFISVLIIQGLLGSPDADIQKMEKMYTGLDESLKNTKPGKAIKTRLDQAKSPSVGAAPSMGDAPSAGNAK
jgi:hypothetical protein